MAEFEKEIVGHNVIGKIVKEYQYSQEVDIRWIGERSVETIAWDEIESFLTEGRYILHNHEEIWEVVYAWVCMECGEEAFYSAESEGFYCPVCDFEV
jgi:rubrerythrin